MKNKTILSMMLLTLISMISCSKDKNLVDYNREQYQNSLSVISAISGTYNGEAISMQDGSSLGAVTLVLQPKTNVRLSSTDVTGQSTVTVSGTISIAGLNSSKLDFSTGCYNENSGKFNVDIPVKDANGTDSVISLDGKVANGSWSGTIEVSGQSQFAATLDLSMNAPALSKSKLSMVGLHMAEMKQLEMAYTGTITINDHTRNIRLSFANQTTTLAQKILNLFSGSHAIPVVFDFGAFKLTYFNAIYEESTRELNGSWPLDEKGQKISSNLYCLKTNDSGWDCDFSANAMTYKLHLGPSLK